jgi:hypothetical protein
MTKLNFNDWLPWLADSPLFIDEVQVQALYDALVRPEFETGPVKLKVSKATETESTYSLGGEANLGLGGFLTKLFPSLTVKGEYARLNARRRASDIEIELNPVQNPYRQLLHLVLHYISNLPDRVVAVDDQFADWPDQRFISTTPRALVVIDLEPGTVLLPTAAEATDGKVHLIYPQDPEAPKYPSAAPSDEALVAGRAAYWAWMLDNFDAQKAMIAVETAATEADSRFEWIDYRMALWADEKPAGTAHLHLAGRGQYSTGTYAYNIVKRGSKHGIRVVGMLKSEPDINVLAIFER